MDEQKEQNEAADGQSELTVGLGAWIPLDESKPPKGIPVLRWPGWAAEISIDEWSDTYNCFLMSIEDDAERATHWMPMPKAPNA